MCEDFKKYKEELSRIRLTRDSKAALAGALAAHRPEREKTAKRPPRRTRLILVAAAFVLGTLALTATALPGFWSLLGVRHYAADPGNGSRYSVSMFGNEVEAPVEAAEGRVWFVFDGLRMDITGQFDEEHAFVYETINPETGLPNYILVGWSAGGIGYGEIVFLPGEAEDGVRPFSAHTLGVVWMDPDCPIFDHTYAPDPDANGWFINAVEEICAPNLEKIRSAAGAHEAQPPSRGPDCSALPAGPG